MCVIVAIEAGKNVSRGTLSKCFAVNSDGAGLAWFDGTETRVRKGLMTFREFYKEYQRVIKTFPESSVLCHFRISTHGARDATMTHPFPCRTDLVDDDMTLLDYSSDIVIAHNGIIYNTGRHKVLSDTALYIRDTLSSLQRIAPKWYTSAALRFMVREHIESKMCVFTNNQFYFIGKFENKEGVYFSNLNHERSYLYDDYEYPNGYKFIPKPASVKAAIAPYKEREYMTIPTRCMSIKNGRVISSTGSSWKFKDIVYYILEGGGYAQVLQGQIKYCDWIANILDEQEKEVIYDDSKAREVDVSYEVTY